MDKEILERLERIATELRRDDGHWEIGEKYFVRTVTHHFTGKLDKVTKEELVFSEAAWVADDGRFANALEKGEVKEAEPYPQDVKVIIGRGSLIDASPWKHALIKKVIPS